MIERNLLKHLVCPITKQALLPATDNELQCLNKSIEQAEVFYQNGEQVTHRLTCALVTQNKTVIYTIDDDVPILIEERSIPTRQITNWR